MRKGARDGLPGCVRSRRRVTAAPPLSAPGRTAVSPAGRPCGRSLRRTAGRGASWWSSHPCGRFPRRTPARAGPSLRGRPCDQPHVPSFHLVRDPFCYDLLLGCRWPSQSLPTILKLYHTDRHMSIIITSLDYLGNICYNIYRFTTKE